MWGIHFGINWAGISYASWLLLVFSILATALFVIVMSALNAVVMLKLSSGLNNSLETSKLFVNAQKARRLTTRWAPSVALFIVGYVLGQASVFSPVRELHGVEVLDKVTDRTYAVIVPAQWNPPAQKDRNEIFKLCPEGDDLPLIKGMIVEPFQYIQQKDCMLINSTTYVDWLRDKGSNVVDRNGKILFAKEDQ